MEDGTRNYMRNKSREGFTYLELIIAIVILVPVILGLIQATAYSNKMSELARSVTTAIADASSVMENIRNTARSGLGSVTGAYPSGSAVAGYSNLTSEQIVVTYPSATADPLDITITVTWEQGGRSMTRIVKSKVTQK